MNRQEKLIKEESPQSISKILAKDKHGKQKYSYMLKQLDYSSQLKLLYRASQHKFSAVKFHQYYDGVNYTLIIVRTEFGKTIAAYTPLKWGSNGNYAADHSKQSLLFQLELKQKMSLTNPQKAIFINKSCGPIFGGGHDLYISDQCDQKRSSCSYFPHSYNCNNKYQNSQLARIAFCGSPNGIYFKVVQYEVSLLSNDLSNNSHKHHSLTILLKLHNPFHTLLWTACWLIRGDGCASTKTFYYVQKQSYNLYVLNTNRSSG